MIKEGYPGNPELPEATKFRIEASFKQAVSLFLNGNMDDCIMGCDFILKLDPQFEPARVLMEKAKDPNYEADLKPILERYGPEEEINIEEYLIKAIELYNSREFEKTLEILNKVLLKDPANNEAKEMFERAKEKLEVQAFVSQFIKRAQTYFDEGALEDALKEVNKGLALDETNPELIELKEKIENLLRKPEEVEIMQEAGPVETAPEEAMETGFALEQPVSVPEQEELPVEEVSGPSFEIQKEKFEEEIKEEKEMPGESPVVGAEKLPEEESLIENFPVAEKVPASGQSERIQSLLNDGDRAFQLGEYQEAIDIWSRIFLIDMDNEEAAKKIEEAKQKIAEEERKIEELYSIALSLLQQGKKEEAKKHFIDILSIEPHHIGARNYLKQLEDEEELKEHPKIKMEEKPVTLEEILPEIPKKEEVPKAPPKKKNILLPLGIAFFIILVLVGGWFLMEGRSKKQKTLSPDLLLLKAEGLINQGKLEEAQQELLKISPEAKEHARALELITKIKTEMASKKKEMIDGRPAGVVFEEYRGKAYNAYKQKDYATAEEYYRKAQEIKPLSFEDKSFYEDVQKILNQINTAKNYVSAGNYEQATSILVPIYNEEKIIQAKELLILSYYNLGVRKLKEENLEEAYKYFKEVVKIEPEDTEAIKNLKFIERYREARKDLLYQIYLKYLPSR